MNYSKAVLSIVLMALPFVPAVAQGPAADIAAIDRLRQDLRRLTRDGDVAASMRLFTEDAMYLRPGEAADSGREAVRRHWQEGVDAMVTDIDYRTDEIAVSGDFAFLRGALTFRGTPRAGGNPVVSEQRFIWILRRHTQDGWQIARYLRHAAPRVRPPA
jgi:uncharacterized protein (TIGR02246 family)